MTDFTRDDLLDILETSLKAQLRAVRSLRSGPPPPSQPEPVERRSNMAVVEELLKQAGHSLHVTEIIKLARARFDRSLSRESLVSALTKKVQEGRTFRRVAPNTFDLLSREDRP
jgi:hypothetical protein